MFCFGYDHFNDVYKVVAIYVFKDKKNDVNVHTLGTGYWRRIMDFPYSGCMHRPGEFMSGTINWLTYDVSSCSSFPVIVSLNLGNESYQKLLQPDLKDCCTLGMLRDCLCIFASEDMFLDVWVMKEYGIKSLELNYTVFLMVFIPISGFCIFLKMINC